MNDINELREAILKRQTAQPERKRETLRNVLLVSLTLGAFVLMALAVM